MSTPCFYRRINDKWVPRVFMGGQIINWIPRVFMGGKITNEFLVFLSEDK